MRTTNQINSEDQERFIGESVTAKTRRGGATLPPIDHARRSANRTMPKDFVLSALVDADPRLYELCEVVGEWLWISLAEPPPQQVRITLAQLGFHWNNTRQCWQHPCGQLRSRGQQEPREKYESFYPADRANA